jgi:hypothetical protein
VDALVVDELGTAPGGDVRQHEYGLAGQQPADRVARLMADDDQADRRGHHDDHDQASRRPQVHGGERAGQHRRQHDEGGQHYDHGGRHDRGQPGTGRRGGGHGQAVLWVVHGQHATPRAFRERYRWYGWE